MSRLLEGRNKDKMKELNVKNKEKERVKEREKEARSNKGHLFTSLTVSSTTLCSSCNRSITAKEALSCPGCNVTIHNRCRDSLASCAKMKQKQQKLAMARNSSALQKVALRTKTPMMKERPSSAIYPSDSLRQSLLGSRRVRSGLSLAKSVSTNNIAGVSEDSVGLRRILSQSTESLNFRSRTLSMESLTDDGDWWWSPLLEELQEEGRSVQADSWSLVVEAKFLQTLHKDLIKQQDVIYGTQLNDIRSLTNTFRRRPRGHDDGHRPPFASCAELIQTEFHHVRTLRIMEGVYRRGMQEEVMLEAGVVHTIFPCLDQLLELHTAFLAQLMARRKQGTTEGGHANFVVPNIGELLLTQCACVQFSGQSADDMKKVYSEFCSRHPKAVKLYKDVLTRDRRLQHFIRRACRGPLLRRHGVQECILLVTQRITKYPVLVQRILDNTKGNEDEARALSQALGLLKELIGSVDREVLELDRTRRLQEVQARLDPRAQAEVRGGGLFRGGELLRRKLLHEGMLLWKVQGSRMKDIHVLLLSDILVFLQEKDQKFTFASFDKSPVVSLTKLIVRDIANQERGMYLISDSTPPEMYELHASSKDARRTWMNTIHQASLSCPSREDFPLIETEDKALLRRLKADILQKDREVLELLQERVTLFSELAEATGRSGAGEGGPEVGGAPRRRSDNRKLFRADAAHAHAPPAEPLLAGAICEVDKLSHLLAGCNIMKASVANCNQELSNGEPATINASVELNSSKGPSLPLKDTNGNQLQEATLKEASVALKEEVRARLVSVSTQLHALQAAVIRQDSAVELFVRTGPAPGATSWPRLSRSVSRDTGLDGGEAVLLRRQVELLQEEVKRLRGREEELGKQEAEPVGRRRSNGDLSDVIKGEPVRRRRGSRELELHSLAPLATHDPLDQLDGVQEANEDEEDQQVVKISPRSDSPRDLQDIPEESECGTDPS
ncbi:rho guanine nucleotide exchange factor 2-like isoform X2 [Phyllopteryx taeniolatus]|uniref:rho guanine nucleotide exchange factor 2-like isoform X2 n=1 Tax=Phyllopteryx taeniolatus TaxID=161469 RepID=UPI002AD1D69B|nr:rho guanine nucleotide exchange factor 2-like isoform X2 [Phyllopteryx taeniolatus]